MFAIVIPLFKIEADALVIRAMKTAKELIAQLSIADFSGAVAPFPPSSINAKKAAPAIAPNGGAIVAATPAISFAHHEVLPVGVLDPLLYWLIIGVPT